MVQLFLDKFAKKFTFMTQDEVHSDKSSSNFTTMFVIFSKSTDWLVYIRDHSDGSQYQVTWVCEAQLVEQISYHQPALHVSCPSTGNHRYMSIYTLSYLYEIVVFTLQKEQNSLKSILKFVDSVAFTCCLIKKPLNERNQKNTQFASIKKNRSRTYIPSSLH